MITEEYIKEMLELMPYISKIIEEYKIFCKEHPEDRSEMEREMVKIIYSIAKKDATSTRTRRLSRNIRKYRLC